ncbi:hypothetical protein [Agromyces cerinus]|uniref:Uncharacterized protein n=1 Tax=Agromyces cerinus subsp. cerinus TaxID=232089 RepID=A0A1N6EPB2_9MICO|nr:hypothetical protein [Agromyces cerinus]SIN84807.1 hypothetical protein SAMN05443544_1334 [Agromyces cerinus subsp. cerinus]
MDFLVAAFGVLVILGGISIIGALRRIADATEEIAQNTRDRADVDADAPQ